MLFAYSLSHKNPEIYKYIIESKELKQNLDITQLNPWKSAIWIKDLDAVKYLVSVDNQFNKSNIIIEALTASTLYSLDIAKFLIDDKNMPFHTEVNQLLKENGNYNNEVNKFVIPNIQTVFITACKFHDQELVDFYLQHKEYGKMIDSFSFLEGLSNTIHHNKLDLFEYLLTNKDMPFKAYIDYNPEKLLQIAAKKGSIIILDYLILDFKISTPKNCSLIFDVDIISSNIAPFINQDEVDRFNKIVKHAMNLFEKRDLHDGLISDLKENPSINKVKRKL